MIASTQLAARLHGPRDLRIEEAPIPRPREGEVLVGITRVGICASDVHFYREGRIGPTQICEPLVLGHEAAGVVVAVGANADSSLQGQRVAIEPGVPCRSCEMCRIGRYNLCPDIAFFAFPPTDGALTEYVSIDARFVHRVSDRIDDDCAALIEPLAVAINAVKRVEIEQGDFVTVTGTGSIGLLCTQLAAMKGAVVTAVDPRQEARELAGRFGASRAIDPVADALPRADVHLECSGNPEAILRGIDSLAPGGSSVLVGVGPDQVSIPLTALRRRELTVTSSFRYANVYPEAIELAERGEIDLKSLISNRCTLTEVAKAFDDWLESGTRTHIKTVVEVV